MIYIEDNYQAVTETTSELSWDGSALHGIWLVMSTSLGLPGNTNAAEQWIKCHMGQQHRILCSACPSTLNLYSSSHLWV